MAVNNLANSFVQSDNNKRTIEAVVPKKEQLYIIYPLSISCYTVLSALTSPRSSSTVHILSCYIEIE